MVGTVYTNEGLRPLVVKTTLSGQRPAYGCGFTPVLPGLLHIIMVAAVVLVIYSRFQRKTAIKNNK